MRIFKHVFKILPILIAVYSATDSAPAHGEEGEGLSIDIFAPSTSVDSIFKLALPQTKEHLKWHVFALASYTHAPVIRRFEGGEAQAVAYRWGADVGGSVGVMGFGEIGLALPIVINQNGEGAQAGGQIQHFAVGDPRLELKANLLQGDYFALGVGGIATLPVGHYSTSGGDFMGPVGPTFEPRALMAMDVGWLLLGLNVGFLARPKASLGQYTQASSLTAGVAAAIDIGDFDEPNSWRFALEVDTMAGVPFDSTDEIPIQALGGVKYRLPNDLIVTVGGGIGLPNGVGAAPRVFIGVAYDVVLRNCPAGPEDFDGFQDDDKCIDPDNDNDGILDINDKCPNGAEDVDEYKDDDGCPDRDNDGDKISDVLDLCPMIHEDVDQYEDGDGCPEEGPHKPTVRITDSQLLISSKIYFDFNKATIKEISYPILDAVAEALEINTQIKLLRIEGHTDKEGTKEYNLQLSRDRAKAVMEYLIRKNIDEERLTYEGYGFTKPKASNRTEEGRAINRRVEFTILKKE